MSVFNKNCSKLDTEKICQRFLTVIGRIFEVHVYNPQLKLHLLKIQP